MALFGKADSLAALVERAREAPPAGAAELSALLERICGHPGCRPPAMAWLLGHADPRIRAFGASWLVPRIDDRVVGALLREMVGKAAPMRDEIARAVVTANLQSRVEAAIGQMIHAAAVEQREAALSLIAALPGWQKELRHLRVALQDPVPTQRQMAVRILCRGDKNRTIHLLLLDLLRDEDPAIRRLVIPALAENPRPDVVQPFLEQLSQEGPAEQARIVDALKRLAANPEAKLAERLIPVLADEDGSVREAAVGLLGQMPNAAEILRSFLVYSRGLAFWLRDRAAASIMKISGDIVEPLSSLMQDPDEDIRIGAVLMASSCRDPRIVPRTLEIFLGADDWWIRSIAAEVLGHFPSPEVTRALQSRLGDPDLQSSVIGVLAKMGNSEAVASLLGCLEDSNRGTRMAALEALADLAGPEIYEALQRVALGDPEPSLRDKAVAILESHRPASEPYLRGVAEAGCGMRQSESACDGDALTMENEAL